MPKHSKKTVDKVRELNRDPRLTSKDIAKKCNLTLGQVNYILYQLALTNHAFDTAPSKWWENEILQYKEIHTDVKQTDEQELVFEEKTSTPLQKVRNVVKKFFGRNWGV